MDAYYDFAEVYDMFMDNIDYDAWGKYLTGMLRRFGVSDGIVAELGCGTGQITERLAGAGYDMIGIDVSGDMLDIAMEKKFRSGHDILYLQQDMRAFELYGTVRAVVSCCDSLNYILEEKELLQVFRLVNNYLDPGGVFLFDMSTEKKYEQIGDSVIAENRDEGSLIWENHYDPEKKLNEYLLTLFLPEGDSEMYRKCEELHCQRAYPPLRVQALLEKAGLQNRGCFDFLTDRPFGGEADRVLFAAVKPQQ